MKHVKIEVVVEAPGDGSDPAFVEGWESDSLGDILAVIGDWGGKVLGVESI